MLVDTHCHLNFESFAADREAVVERARQAGVGRMLNPGIDLPTSREAVALAEQYPEVYAAVGVHPNDLPVWGPGVEAALRALAAHPKVIAIGEIGLDDYWEQTPRPAQEQALQAQLELAAGLGLPVVIHVRNARPPGAGRATSDALAILGEWQRGLQAAGSPLAARPGVLHSYSDSLELALQAVRLNFYLGVTGPVTFKKADELRRVAAGVPLEALLIETDAPFLTPHPHRGQRNEPAYVAYVAGQIASLRGLEIEQLTHLIAENAERLFLWQVTP